MFDRQRNFRCKLVSDATREVVPLFVKDGWVAAITVCRDRLRTTKEMRVVIPDVEDLSLDVDGGEVTITWAPSDYYLTELEYRTDDGEWTTVTLEVGVGEA